MYIGFLVFYTNLTYLTQKLKKFDLMEHIYIYIYIR